MITKLQQSEGPVLGVEITGKVSLEEEKAWIAQFDGLIEQHGKVSALVVLGEEASWGIEAGLEDLKWLMTHLKQLNRIAVVSHSTVWKWLIAIDSPFAQLVGINEKHFEPSQIEAAWAWVKK